MKIEGKFVPRGGLSLCVVAEHPNPSPNPHPKDLP
jgi:NADPH-dependent 7-cyano-7-deazaguanine reductase QueF